MKVLIYPTDDRLGQASLIDHYNKIGCEVYLPARGTLGLNWSKNSLWPALLCRSPVTGTRNIDFARAEQSSIFGEDYFLTLEGDFSNDLKDVPECRILEEKDLRQINFDAYHTLRGADENLTRYMEIANESFPRAKWISSTLSAYDFQPKSLKPYKTAKIIPAPYSDLKGGLNVYCTDVEFRLFDLQKDSVVRTSEVASFNHNFHVRQPQDYKMFCEMNGLLEKMGHNKVLNYGGNIRGMGADIRYSNGGPTGNYTTLSPRKNLEKILSLSAIVHFKGTDWGGGVFFHALHTGTPIITTQRYIDASKSNSHLIHGFNCIVVNNSKEAAHAVIALSSDLELRNKLSLGMSAVRQTCFSEEYWRAWKEFVEAQHA